VSTSTDLVALKKVVVDQIIELMGMEMAPEQDEEAQQTTEAKHARAETRRGGKKLRSVRYDISKANNVQQEPIFDSKLQREYYVLKVGEEVLIPAERVPQSKYPDIAVPKILPQGLSIRQGDFALEGTPKAETPLKTYMLKFGGVQTKISFAVVPSATQPYRIEVTAESPATANAIILCGQKCMVSQDEVSQDELKSDEAVSCQVSCRSCGESQGPWKGCCKECSEAQRLLCASCYEQQKKQRGVPWGVNGTSGKLTFRLVKFDSNKFDLSDLSDQAEREKWKLTCRGAEGLETAGGELTIDLAGIQKSPIQVHCSTLPPLQVFVHPSPASK